MGTLSSVPSASPVIALSTLADSIGFVFPCAIIRWVLTTAATSTWALHITQSSDVAGSTVAWPLIGTSTAALYLGGSTASYSGYSPVDFQINAWVFGAVLSTMTGGHVEFIKGAPGLDWVIKKPYMLTTVRA